MKLNKGTLQTLLFILGTIGLTFTAFSKGGEPPMKQAVEFLVFEMSPKHREAFIQLDHKIWTDTLSKQKGFVSKEVWIDDHHPNQVTLVTYWTSYKHWKSIPHDELNATNDRFTKEFGHKFKLIKELHKVHRWHRIKNTKTP